MTQEALWQPDLSESLGVCWGLDPGTAALALGIYNGVGFASRTCSLPRHADPLRRLEASLPVAQRFLEESVGLYGEPSLALIEQPAGHGHNVHPATWFITAATGMAVVRVVDCPVQMAGPTTWKSEALGKGNGNANKERVQSWARDHHWKGTGEHEADASAMAFAAYLRLAKHLGASNRVS